MASETTIRLRLTMARPYGGTYDLDIQAMTNRDAHIVKRISGYTQPEWPEAMARQDLDLWIGLAICALRHNGHDVDERLAEMFLDMPMNGWLDIVDDEPETDDADPPPRPSS